MWLLQSSDYMIDTINKEMKTFDFAEHVLSRCKHMKQKMRVPTVFKTCERYNKIILKISPDAKFHILNNVSMVFPESIWKSLDKVLLSVGGQRFDVMHFGDAFCDYLHKLYNTPSVSHMKNGNVCVHLPLCGTTSNCFYYVHNQLVHDITLEVYTSTLVGGEIIELWADTYYLDYDMRKELYGGFYMVSQQTQFTGVEKLKNGNNKIPLYFNHPAYELFFHLGSQHFTYIENIEHVKLTFQAYEQDDWVHFDGPVQHLSCKKGYVSISMSGNDVVPSTIPKGMVNFSRTDRALLELTVGGLDDEQEINLYVFLHSYQLLRYASGMYGLTYSK